MQIKRMLFCFAMALLPIVCSACSTETALPPEEQTVALLNRPYNKTLDGGETVSIPVSKDVGTSNYLRIESNSEVGVEGILCYSDPDEPTLSFQEKFYLEKDREYIFGLLIGQEELENNTYFERRVIDRIEFRNLENVPGKLRIESITMGEKELKKDKVYLENEKIRIGANLAWGGGLFYFADLSRNVVEVEQDGKQKIGVDYDKLPGARVTQSEQVNLLNHHDVGRLVQQSYYGSILPPYEPGVYLGNTVPYNPVQGGDTGNNESKIVDYEITESSIYVKCQPRDWAPAKLSPCYMENWYTLEGSVLKVENRFVDFSMFTPQEREQEMPAVYTVRNLDRWVVYDGDAPFTGGELSVYQTDVLEAAGRIVSNSLSENWVALCNEQNFGVGIYVPDLTDGIYSLFGQNDIISDPDQKYYDTRMELLNCTSYTTMTARVAFASLKPMTYTSYVSAGYVSEMRESFAALHAAGANNQAILQY